MKEIESKLHQIAGVKIGPIEQAVTMMLWWHETEERYAYWQSVSQNIKEIEQQNIDGP